MEDSSGRFQLVSVAEAARILNLSDSTVRRLVKAGRLEAQQVQRPQGHVWLVKVPSPGQQPPDQPSWQIGAAGASQPSPSTLPAPSEAMVSLIQTTIATVLGPLVAELAASRETIERQGATIAELHGARGRLTAALEAAIEAKSALEAQRAAETARAVREPSTARLRALAPWLLAVLALVVVVALLVWPR